MSAESPAATNKENNFPFYYTVTIIELMEPNEPKNPKKQPEVPANKQKQQQLQQLQVQLKTLQQKCELQSKKIKLYRKENEQLKLSLARQAQTDTGLLLNSKELSDANTKLESAIRDISLKLEITLESASGAVGPGKPAALVTIQHTTITQQTQEVDLPNQGIVDQDLVLLSPFKGLKSLILGENKIGDAGVMAISSNLANVSKLQLNSNCFTAQSLKYIHNLKHLKVLDIRNNKLGDHCMQYLCKLCQLAELSLSKNSISDQGAKWLRQLTGLVYLDLTNNLITDLGVQSLLQLRKLTHLYLMSNRITSDAVFSIFQNLLNVEVLDVRFNINEPAAKESLRVSKPGKIQLFC